VVDGSVDRPFRRLRSNLSTRTSIAGAFAIWAWASWAWYEGLLGLPAAIVINALAISLLHEMVRRYE